MSPPGWLMLHRKRGGASGRKIGGARMLELMEPFDEDAKLMVRYRDGDADAFSTLYARHKGPLYRYLLRQVRNAGAAADLFQEVWSRLVGPRGRGGGGAPIQRPLFLFTHQ